jgi:hypothetical protein
MSPLDLTSLEGPGRPKTLDGREYPEHLEPYEAIDDQMLAWASSAGEFYADGLYSLAESVSRLVAPGPRWLASAEWRGLIERRDRTMADDRTYAITERGLQRLRDLRS